jgi:hypothetical protein
LVQALQQAYCRDSQNKPLMENLIDLSYLEQSQDQLV